MKVHVKTIFLIFIPREKKNTRFPLNRTPIVHSVQIFFFRTTFPKLGMNKLPSFRCKQRKFPTQLAVFLFLFPLDET